MCDKYLLFYYKETIIEILKDVDDNKHFSVNVDFVELSGNDPNLGNNFLRDPEKSLEEWNKALKTVQTNLILQSEENYTFKEHSHCRIYSLPLYPELHRTKLPQNQDTNKFLQVSGTVIRMTAVKMLEHQRQYICTKCKYVMIAYSQYEMKNIITPPKKCSNPEECKGTNIVAMGELSAEFCKDYQEIKIQETVSKLDVSSMSSSMWVTLEDDLVDSCKPGDNITICGLIKRRQNQFVVGKKIEVQLVIRANHIQVNNNTSNFSITPELKDMFVAFWKTYANTPLSARDIILKSICPQLFGLYIVKLAVAVVLAGGSTHHKNFDTGVRVRAEPHLLLVGDPGTGKSQLLRFASKVIPRSVLTTGVGSTAAGLTVTALMEGGEWQLEGGALVMSDGGICCIDEFNTMKEHDRTSIHEAMEQQTISVAKAGIVTKLSTQCSILAATNPKGNLNLSQPLSMNVALPSPLLSRFDLILLLRDTVDHEWDSQLVDYIFNSFENCNSSKLTENINWTVETLQAYFSVIKKIHPVLTEDANKILRAYYQAQRKKNVRNKARTTVRLLDSLARLSQGHARLMYHIDVQIVDAVMAVILVETGVEADCSIFNLHFNFKNDFPSNATANYRELVEIVLTRLELPDLLQKELNAIDIKKPNDRPGGAGNNNLLDKPGPSNIRKSPIANVESKFFQINLKEDKTEAYSKPKIKKEMSEIKHQLYEKQPDENKENNIEIMNKKENTFSFTERKNLSRCEREMIENKDVVEEENTSEDDGCENENYSTKRKSKNLIKSKKVKRTKQEHNIKRDVAALNCMRSVLDIQMNESDMEDGIGVSIEELDSNSESIQGISGSKNGKQKISFSAINSIENNSPDTSKDDNIVKKIESLSKETTPTKNYFSKFKYVPKETQPEPQPETVVAQNIFENDASILGDISFANVQSSTQTEKPNLEEQHNKCVISKPIEKDTNNVTKKFNFKKVVKPSETHLAENPTTSIFEDTNFDEIDLNI